MLQPTHIVPLLVVLIAAPAPADAPFSHAAWQAVLVHFVDQQGFVDYHALMRDRSALDSYVESLATTSPAKEPARFPQTQDRLAYYLNAYNAQVFAGVLDRGPEEKSVWSGGLISGYRFFVKRKISLGGKRMSLKHLEDKIIRAGFQDPRVHAALNCASVSCPRLAQDAFLPATLDAQLDAAMREFVSTPAHLRIDRTSRTVHLSRIFDWYEGDFLEDERKKGVSKPSLLGYVNRFRARNEQIDVDFRVDFLAYDKSINSASP